MRINITIRQAIEKAVITAAIDQLLAAGYSLGVNDGEETTLARSTSKAEVLAALFTTDEDWILVYEKSNTKGNSDWWIRLVYGNDGYDVISDYCVALESDLTQANALANRIGDGDFTITIT